MTDGGPQEEAAPVNAGEAERLRNTLAGLTLDVAQYLAGNATADDLAAALARAQATARTGRYLDDHDAEWEALRSVAAAARTYREAWVSPDDGVPDVAALRRSTAARNAAQAALFLALDAPALLAREEGRVTEEGRRE